jgi:MoaA/NifB/PqqE/SkfB family radical SAM enzyme
MEIPAQSGSLAAIGGSFPQHVNVETVNYCNARCPFCPLFQGRSPLDREIRPAGVMSSKLFANIMEEIAAWPERPTLTVNMDGEPLMDPNFVERMAVLRLTGLAASAHIETNGHLLTEERSHAILRAPLAEIRFAFDGATKETYELHRVRCDYDRVLGNLRRFAMMRDEFDAPTRILLKFTRTQSNAHEVASCYALMNQFMSPAKDIFLDTITHSWAQKELEAGTLYNVAQVDARKFNAEGCSLTNSRMVILLDGRVPACSLDYNFFIATGGFGNVADLTVAAVWRAIEFERHRDALRNASRGEIPAMCKRCINLYETPDVHPQPVMQDERILLWRSPYNYAYRFTGP